MRPVRTSLCLSILVLLLLVVARAASAQTSLDPVGLATVSAGHAKVRLTVTAGGSGAPDGFTVCWMTRNQFEALGGVWPDTPVPGEGSASFTGVATLNTWGAAERSFRLVPGEPLDVEIGDLADESGVSGTVRQELPDGEEYVFRAYANGGSGPGGSSYSVTLASATTAQGQNCTYSWGYWRQHSEMWPVPGLTLGTVTYTQAQLLQILEQQAGGNGLISLAHQLIAAKLSIANGADDDEIAATIAAADALIGSLVVPPIGSGSLPPAQTAPYTQALDDYAQGTTGPGHCTTVRVDARTWGAIKSLYR